MRILRSAVFFAGVAAASGGLSAQTRSEAAFEDVFEWVRLVELQQNDQVIVSRPRITADPLGGWLVVDPPEAQVRMYDRSGGLNAFFGGEGQGPGEFDGLAGVVRTSTGDLITVDMTGTVARWSSDGRGFNGEFRVPLRGISDAALIDDDSLMVLTPPVFSRGRSSGPVLHVIDLSAGRIARSFYEPEIPENARNAWVTFVGGSITSQDEIMGVTLPLLDSILLFGDAAAPSSRIPLGIVGHPSEFPDARVDRAVFMEWARRIAVVGPVQATGDGWVVPLLRVGGNADGRVDLLFFAESGGASVLIRDAPILIGADDETGEFIFDDPEQLEPQHVRTARIRRP